MAALDQRAGEAMAEAAALEETREKRLQEQKDWNVTLAATQKVRKVAINTGTDTASVTVSVTVAVTVTVTVTVTIWYE